MFARFSVKRPVTITMFVLIIIVLGVISFSELKVDLLPQMQLPYVMVQTSYSGAGPEEIETMVTRPLEQTVATVESLEGMLSYSNEGSSLILMQFSFNTDLDQIMLQIREKIDMIQGFLPEGTSAPIVAKLDPNALPIIQMTVSAQGDLYTSQRIAEDVISPRIERIEGTASANVTGGLEQEVEIMLKEEALKGYKLNQSYIGQLLQAANINLPGGSVKKGSKELTARVIGEFESVEEIRNFTIPLTFGGTVRLRDIAQVNLLDKNRESITRMNGKEVVSISVMKQSDANTVNVSRDINKELEKIKEEYPDLNIVTIFDQAEYINLAIENLSNSAIEGGILAVIVLLFFLKSLKSTLVIAIAIPISIIATFVILYFSGITLNMLTIGGLAVGIGMLVDNSIVVLENIYRYRSLGTDRITSAVDGTNEMLGPVVASTLTTIVVFIPIVFTGGLTAEIFTDLALSISIALITSLLVSLTLVPMLSSKLVTVKNPESEEEQEKRHGPLMVLYKKILAWSLKHRFIIVTASVLLFIASIGMVISVGAELFPATDEGMINVTVSMPPGSETKEIDALVGEIQAYIQEIPEVESVFTQASKTGTFGTGGGSMSVILSDLADRDRSSKEIADEIRTRVKDIPGAEISVSESSMVMMGMGSTGAISISVEGDDLDTLKAISDDFKNIIEGVEGTREVATSYEDGIPQVQIVADRGLASQYGLTTAQIGSAVSSTLSGSKVTSIVLDGNETDLVLKGDNIYGESMSFLEMLPIETPSGSRVPLSQIAQINVEEGPVSILRQNQKRVFTVTASVTGRDIQSVSVEIERLLSQYQMPRGYTYTFGGETKMIEETFTDLGKVFLVALLLIYMIIAAQFESLIQPFCVMFTVPLALTGSFIALYITNTSLNVIGIIGLIVLAGVVVNNAVVIIDYIITRREKGEDRNTAIIKAGPIRMRPIMMTALTTILGLVPMSLGIGEGAELTQSMGIVISGGMILSTGLTLLVVPVMYTIFDDITAFFYRRFRKNNVNTIEQL